MKMMPPDVISHQLQHLSEPSIFMLDVSRTADHAGQIFIPHRPFAAADNLWAPPPSNFIDRCVAPLIICLQSSIANNYDAKNNSPGQLDGVMHWWTNNPNYKNALLLHYIQNNFLHAWTIAQTF